MRISEHAPNALLNPTVNKALMGNNQSASKSKAERDKLEQKIREEENKQMDFFRERIADVQENKFMDDDAKKIQIDSLTTKIQNIMDRRQQREIRRQEEMQQEEEAKRKEALQKREEAAKKAERNKPVDPAKAEAEASNPGLTSDHVEAFVTLTLSKESMHAFKSTQTRMSAEASRLNTEIKKDAEGGTWREVENWTLENRSNPTKPEYMPNVEIRDDFKHRLRDGLEKGIKNLENAIHSEVSKINDQVDNLQDAGKKTAGDDKRLVTKDEEDVKEKEKTDTEPAKTESPVATTEKE